MGRLEVFVWLAVACGVAGCRGDMPVGRWDAWSIGGLPLSEAEPSVMDMPAYSSGRVDLEEGDLRNETFIDSLQLQVLPGGDFREVRVSRTDHVISADAYRRLSGRGTTEVWVREPGEFETSEFVGSWRTQGDSLFLYQTADQKRAAIAAAIRKGAPDLDPEIRDSLVAEILNKTGVPSGDRWKGVVNGDRATLTDMDGRVWVFRRSAPRN